MGRLGPMLHHRLAVVALSVRSSGKPSKRSIRRELGHANVRSYVFDAFSELEAVHGVRSTDAR